MSEDLTHRFPNDGFDRILTRLDSIDEQLRVIKDKTDSLDSRMAALEEKVDRRLLDTQPIWEQVLVRLDTIESRLGTIESRLGTIESRLDRVEDELHDLNQKFRVFLKDVVRLQDAQEDLDERVQKLESTPTA